VAPTAFETFRLELGALKSGLTGLPGKTVRDDDLRTRFQNLYRTWVSVVSPSLGTQLQNRRGFFKLAAELEAIAKLSTKVKRVADYRKRLNTAVGLADGLVIYLPPSSAQEGQYQHVASRLFLAQIPDLPSDLVPSALLGSRSRMEAFIGKYPFDRSVFIMVPYRKRTEAVIAAIKESLKVAGFDAIVARDHRITDDLYNPIACLLSCGRGIAVFDKQDAKVKFNPNVAYELGMMHLLHRPCLILKHESIVALHSDILMKLYVPFQSPASAAREVTQWLTSEEQPG